MSDIELQRTSHRSHVSLSRRGGLRVHSQGLCTELDDEHEQLGLVLDVSETGLRLERPHRLMPSRRRERVVQLEFEHPAVDELIWAKGVIRFDKLEPVRERSQVMGVRRTSGVEIVSAASRHLRIIREFVMDLRKRADPEEPSDERRADRKDQRHQPAQVESFWSTASRIA